MRFTQSLSAVLALAATSSALTVPPTEVEIRAAKPFVESVSRFSISDEIPVVAESEQNKLRRVILRSELLAKAKHLEGLAYATPQRNRLIGTPGHEATVAWIKETIEKFPDYYTVSLQPFDLAVGAGANLTVNRTPLEAYAVDLAPAGVISAPLIVIPNLACEPVCCLSLANSVVLTLQ